MNVHLQPFYRTCIGLNTAQVLKHRAAWEMLQIQPDNMNISTCAGYIVSSAAGRIRQYEGRANIYACPGGKEACPGESKGVCGEGYLGVACGVSFTHLSADMHTGECT